MARFSEVSEEVMRGQCACGTGDAVKVTHANGNIEVIACDGCQDSADEATVAPAPIQEGDIMAHTFMVNGHEMIYHYCVHCIRWRNFRVVKRVGFGAIRVECHACQDRRVIADPNATVR